MSEETEIDTQTLDSSSETFELRFRRQPEMDTPVTKTSANEPTARWVDERQIKQPTDSIFGLLELFCAPLVDRTEMLSVGISEASSSKHKKGSISASRNRNDKTTGVYHIPHRRNWLHRATKMHNLKNSNH